MTSNENKIRNAEAAFDSWMDAGSIEGKLGAVAAFLERARETVAEALERNIIEGDELDKINALAAALAEVKTTTQTVRADWTKISDDRKIAYTESTNLF